MRAYSFSNTLSGGLMAKCRECKGTGVVDCCFERRDFGKCHCAFAGPCPACSPRYPSIGRSISADHVVWELSCMYPEEFERAVRTGKVALIARLFGIKGREITKRVRALQPKHQ
jgi:hypothetical protein